MNSCSFTPTPPPVRKMTGVPRPTRQRKATAALLRWISPSWLLSTTGPLPPPFHLHDLALGEGRRGCGEDSQAEITASLRKQKQKPHTQAQQSEEFIPHFLWAGRCSPTPGKQGAILPITALGRQALSLSLPHPFPQLVDADIMAFAPLGSAFPAVFPPSSSQGVG